MKICTKRTRGFTLIEIMIVVAIIGMLAAIAVPNFMRNINKSKQMACINNLRQIDGAKQMWAMEAKAGPASVPVLLNIQPYLGRGTAGTAPSCPADASGKFENSYDLNDLNSAPTCKILPGVPGDSTGHRLPE